ncbi:hypothetical protein [Leisingera sp. JC1]|uniref:hypothetical protein n=1 Tax=Leisingera sp. JC1 TaxID=1855282 RepID=UPI001C2FBB8E|nr:hypothetical protein [Leisingera sp. JC1]
MAWDGVKITPDEVEKAVRERLEIEVVDDPADILKLIEDETQELWSASYRDGKEIKAAVVLVRWDDEWCNLKVLTEDEGPVATAVPETILDMLTPTSNPFAQEWRDDCRKISSGVSAVIRPGGMIR